MTTVLVYRTPPQSEHKAARELREAGIRAHVPRDRGRPRNPFTKKPPATAPGYVFAERAYSNAFAKHVRSQVGVVPRDQIGRLYLGKPKAVARASAFAVGDKVLKGEIVCTVIDVRERTCRIKFEMMGKQHVQAVNETQLRKL